MYPLLLYYTGHHPHFEGSSALQLNGGMAGNFLVEDEEQEQTYNLDMIPSRVLMVQQFNAGNYDNTASNNGTGTLPGIIENLRGFDGTLMIVNGIINPYLKVDSDVVRFRIANALMNSAINLGFNERSRSHCSLHVLGYDGVFYKTSRPVTTAYVPAGGRVDVVVHCKGGGNHDLTSIQYLAPEDQPPEGGLWGGILDPSGGAGGTPLVSLRMKSPKKNKVRF